MKQTPQPQPQFKELAAQLRQDFPTANIDEYPSAHHYEVRVTDKIWNTHFLTFTWRKTGITIMHQRPHLPVHKQKTILAVELTSVSLVYAVRIIKKYLYDQN